MDDAPADLRKIVEDSVRHARFNVGYTINNHEAAEQNISMNVETILVAVASHTLDAIKQAEANGLIQGAEFANNCLYDNCPTGDVTAWDMLKGVQKTQKQLDAFVKEVKRANQKDKNIRTKEGNL